MPDPIPSRSSSRPSSTEALDTLREELLALDPQTLLSLNVDIVSAATVVIGALPDIHTHRAALVELCGEEMAKSVDRLELLARAALQAHAKHRLVSNGANVKPLSEELVVVRDVLLAEARSMIVRKVIPAQITRELTLGPGYKNLCVDVLQLVSAMREDWDVVEHETRIAMAYLENAEGLANELVTAVGLRDQASRSPAADLRQRAYTVLARTYGQVRQMITFLRWDDGDADRIAPAFHNHRGSRRRKNGASTENTTESVALEAVAAVAVGPGLPGGLPFTTG